MYHHVNPHKGDMVTVTPDVFEGQMRYLRERGYRTLNINELISYINGNLELRHKAVAVTFDDGWLDNYIYAFPVLEKYKINAAVFVITDWTENASGKPEGIPFPAPTHKESRLLVEKKETYKIALNWKTVKEMSDSGLVGFYSHTKSHRRCDELSGTELLEELEDSKNLLEQKTGRSCPYLCWPYGKYNNTALDIAKKTGYKAVFTTEHGVAGRGDDLMAIRRIVVKDSVDWFKKRMLVYTNSVLSACYLKLKRK
ncbi:poly-beta-1,6-N-acetyl-D-glucosamine N-deacetylase precursor [bacterium BMS3Abin06]|nr:poly-beta-1,6-N-acetyl-D-glucosamine N-deacetylase precursor [bacterium BMS3Abin06]